MKTLPAVPMPRCLPVLLLLGFSLGGFGPARAAEGEPEPSFATGGAMLVDFNGDDDSATCMALQGDGKVLVAGSSGGGDFSVLRLLPNGTPDPDFGVAGKVKHSFGLFEQAEGIAEVAGGKILVGGAGLVGSRDFAAMRLLPNGSLDPSYGTGGVVTTDLQDGFNEAVSCMVVDGEGRVTLGGYYRTHFALVRYTAGGVLDPSFGQGGKVYTPGTTTTEQRIQAMALQPDGKLVAVGQSRTGANTDVIVARYLANGTPDPDFAAGGQLVTPVGAGNTSDVAYAVGVQRDGSVVVGGSTAGDYLLLRFTSTGDLDTGFGVGGGVSIGFSNGAVDTGYALALQDDGKILLAGTSTFGGRDYFGLLRFTSVGALDPVYVNGGGSLTALSAGSDGARAMVVQRDGRVLLAGRGGALGNQDFAIARFQNVVPLTLAAWRQFYFRTTANSGNAADEHDFDGDGVVNLFEYAFGLDPTKAGSRSLPSGQVKDGNFEVSFIPPAGVVGLRYGAQSSPALASGSWTSVAEAREGETHTFRVPLGNQATQFLRLSVTAP